MVKIETIVRTRHLATVSFTVDGKAHARTYPAGLSSEQILADLEKAYPAKEKPLSEREALLKKAGELGLTVAKNIATQKLQELVDAAEKAAAEKAAREDGKEE